MKLQEFYVEEAFKQDMYDLGITVLFAITGYKLERLPRIVEDREKKIKKLLDDCVGNYDDHLLGAISRMVGLPGHKPITNKELRGNLDEKGIQAKIIKAESRAHSLKSSRVSDRSLSKSGAKTPEKQGGVSLAGKGKRLSTSDASSARNDLFGVGMLSGSTIGAYKKD